MILTSVQPKPDRLALIKASALRMMQAKGKIVVTFKARPDPVELLEPEVKEIVELTPEEKEFCGIF